MITGEGQIGRLSRGYSRGESTRAIMHKILHIKAVYHQTMFVSSFHLDDICFLIFLFLFMSVSQLNFVLNTIVAESQ